MVSALLLAFALSIDALSVGFTYGLKKIKLPFMPKIFICITSFICSYISVSIGKGLYAVLPQKTGSILSIILLLILGFYILFSTNHVKKAKFPEKLKQYQFVLKFLGLTVTIIKHPVYGDMDKSNVIDLKEALYIGLALSLDSFGAGIGYSMYSSSAVFFPLFVGIFQFILIICGEYLGKVLRQLPINEKLISVLPGIILIILSLIKFINLFK